MPSLPTSHRCRQLCLLLGALAAADCHLYHHLLHLTAANSQLPAVSELQASQQTAALGSTPPDEPAPDTEAPSGPGPSPGPSRRARLWSLVSVYSATSIIVGLTTAMQLVTKDMAAGAMRGAGRRLSWLPWLREKVLEQGTPMINGVQRLVSLRERRPLAFILLHGIVTDASADIIAQAISSQRDSVVLSLDTERIMRGTMVALLSDDIPFLLWAKLMWSTFKAWEAWVATKIRWAPGTRRLLTSKAYVSVSKTLLSQTVYETFSCLFYLALQPLLKGHGLTRVLQEVQSKFWTAYSGGLMFFSVWNLMMYTIPVLFLQPIMDNMGCLIFNVYLSLLSNDADDEDY